MGTLGLGAPGVEDAPRTAPEKNGGHASRDGGEDGGVEAAPDVDDLVRRESGDAGEAGEGFATPHAPAVATTSTGRPSWWRRSPPQAG